MSDPSCTIGVDLGGTKIEIALVDQNGNIQKRDRCKTDVTGGPTAIISEIHQTITKLLSTYSGKIIGVGVGIAGQIDKATGAVHFAPNLEWKEVPLQENLSQVLNLPVCVTNDVRAAAWGEWLHGAGQRCEDLICVFVGTGIGGGIVSGGQMLSGDSNTAGEIGHAVIDINGPYCTCGNKGCWEALAGGWAIGKRARQEITDDPASGAKILKLARGLQGAVTAHHVGEAYAQQDPLAIKIMDDVTEALIAGSIGLVNTLAPQKFILGGGIISGNPYLLERIQKGVRKRALKAATANLEIIDAALGNEAPVIGAASLAWHHFGASAESTVSTPT